MIRTRQEACGILGLSANATTSQIKMAYKDLVKKCHPDVTGKNDATAYNRITEAYQFLMAEAKGKVLTHTKVVGKTKTSHRKTASNADYAAFQKKAAKQKAKKAQEFEQKQREFSAKIAKQEADYKRVMEAIDAIKAARIIEAMIRANDPGNNNEKK
ncbi:MAG: J domain-containing protein [Pseudobutyrivibrio sp.]|nr:J domain-containing protein [Pseudobutyrivibrio sp.]